MKLTDIEDIRNYLRGGSAEFTLQSIKTGSHHTYRLRQIPNGTGFFVTHLTGPDNDSEHDYRYLGIMSDAIDRLIATKATGPMGPAFIGLGWFLRCLASNCEKLSQVEFLHSGKCSKCGRKLTTPESIKRGMGPVCREKL